MLKAWKSPAWWALAKREYGNYFNSPLAYVVAFVILKSRFVGTLSDEEVTAQLRDWVAQQIGAIAKPRTVFVVAELPKTRSGKIMRRLLRDIAEGREVGDTTTLTDTSVIRVISDGLK